LTALHHFLYSGNDLRITDDNCLVETGKEGSASDREGKDLWIVFGNGLARNRGCWRSGSRIRRRWVWWV
jgi:hypothetical protein